MEVHVYLHVCVWYFCMYKSSCHLVFSHNSLYPRQCASRCADGGRRWMQPFSLPPPFSPELPCPRNLMQFSLPVIFTKEHISRRDTQGLGQLFLKNLFSRWIAFKGVGVVGVDGWLSLITAQSSAHRATASVGSSESYRRGRTVSCTVRVVCRT